MTTQSKRAKDIIDSTCYYFGISKEEFYAARSYKCSDARKIAIAVLLESEVCRSITEAADILNIGRCTASIALKTLKEYLPYNKRLRTKYEMIKNKTHRKKSEPKTLGRSTNNS